MSAPEWYAAALRVCQEWATSSATPLDQVLPHLPPTTAPPPMDMTTLAVVVCDFNQGRLTGEVKLKQFRVSFNDFLTSAIPGSALNALPEPWHTKDPCTVESSLSL